MNTKPILFRPITVGLVLFVVLACTLPRPQTVAPTQVITTIVPSASEQSFAASFLSTTLTQTLTPTKIFTKTPTRTPTKMPTGTFTLTALPRLPDFQEVITFAGGGGAGPCYFEGRPPFFLDVHTLDNRTLFASFRLGGIDVAKPFQLILFQPDSPNGVSLSSPYLLADLATQDIHAAEYIKNYKFGDLCGYSDGILSWDIKVWSPIILSPGKWRFSVEQKESAFGVFSSDFWVQENTDPEICVLSSGPKTELVGQLSSYHPYHLVIPKEIGKVDVNGINFPLNAPVYVLLFQKIDVSDKWELLQKHLVQANREGSFAIEFSNLIDAGGFLVVGLSDPNAPLEETNASGYRGFNTYLPHDFFDLISANPITTSSCPGAPPQRMLMNQRGYVCTQSDRIRLRNAPAKSASTIVYVNTGAQFTVIGGPSCSDNWSWWNVRLDDGTTGWLAEGGDAVDPYFICPAP
ncbi:MAG: SH3 domain-containing protein [Chloroflexi bacterium]|nr:SH3 domain-containing protein [Chloroflexota bacterium]